MLFRSGTPAVSRTLRRGVLLVSAIPTIGGGQVPTLAGDWRLTRYTTTDRLPADEVVKLAESSDGRLWASTTRGFAWFDGWLWHPLASDSLSGIRRAARYLWPGHGNSMIAVVHNLLFVGDTSGLTKIPIKVGGKESLVEGAVPIRQGLLVLTRQSADSEAVLVLIRDGRQEPFTAPASLGRRNLAALFPSAIGGAWLNSEAGLWRWDGARWELRFPASDAPFSITWLTDQADGSGLVAIRAADSRAGLWTWERDGKLRHEVREGDAPIVSGTVGRDMAVVIYRGGNIRIRSDDRWHSPAAGDPSFLDARAAFVDRSGDLWIAGSSGLALFRTSSHLWTAHVQGFPSQLDRVHSLLSLPDGSTWAGTVDGIAVYNADGSMRHIASISGRRLGLVTGLARDSVGNIWVSSGSSFEGAYRWDGRSWRHFGAAEGLGADRVHALATDRAGRVWFLGISTDDPASGPGAFVLDRGRFTRWGTAEGLPNGRVYAFAEGPDGTRWFGTRIGLSRWRDGAWKHWTVRRGMVGALTFKMPFRVFSISIDSRGRPWFGGGDPADYAYGLGTIDEKDSLVFKSTADGLLNNVVWQVLADSEGTIWSATEGGVSAYRDGVWFNFGTDRGLGHSSTWPMQLRDGVLKIGSLGGGIRELRLDDARQPTPRVFIEAPVVEGRGALVRWSAHAYRGTLPSHLVETRFRVDSGPWSGWSTNRTASLSDLAVGRHTVSVQAKGLFLPIEPVSARTIVRVQRPVLLRPLAAIPLATLTVALIVLTTVVRRRKRELRLERRKAQAALRASEERFATAFAASPDPMAISTFPEGKVLETNRSFESVTGWSRAECIGKSGLELGFYEDPAVRERIFDELAASGRVRDWEFVLRRRDDGRRVVSLSAEIVELEGQKHLLWVMTDMTEKRSLEAQLAQAQKMEAVGQLAGGVAHDFNNLLTAILGNTQLLREVIDNDAQRSDLDEINRAALRAAELTGQLLTFARKQRVEPRVMNLNDLVHQTDKMLRRVIGERIAVRTRCHHDLPCVQVDPGQIEQVLLNLAVNARDAMPDGGSLTIETDTVVLDEEYAREHPDARPGSYVVLAVSDTGTGITGDVRSRIFEPFFTTKEVGKGTGLGLSICYGIVRQAGGHVAVYTEVGRGTTFRVYLPEVAAIAPASTAAAKRRPIPTGTETVLVVEDEEPVRKLLRRVLAGAGYTVLLAADGEEALHLLATSEHAPDLLVSDVVLPGRTGPEIAREVRQRVPDVAVLYISGYTERAAGHTVAIDGPFMAKPFTPEFLAHRVREVLDARMRTPILR